MFDVWMKVAEQFFRVAQVLRQGAPVMGLVIIAGASGGGNASNSGRGRGPVVDYELSVLGKILFTIGVVSMAAFWPLLFYRPKWALITFVVAAFTCSIGANLRKKKKAEQS